MKLMLLLLENKIMTKMPQINKNFAFGRLSLIRFTILLLLVSMSLDNVNIAQPLTWQKILNNNYGSLYQGKQTQDGGFVAVGSDYVTNNSKLFLTKIDQNGSIEWSRTFGLGNSEGTWIEETKDNGFILCGTTDSAGWHKFYLVKTDSLGELEWYRTYYTSDMDRANCVKETSDNGYIIAGYTFPSSVGVYIIKTDSIGNILTQKVYYSSSESREVREIISTDFGYFAIGDLIKNNQSDIYLMKIDENLDTVWTKTLGGQLNDLGYSIDSINDNEYILGGTTESFSLNGRYQSILYKINSGGSVLWQRTYSGLGNELCKTVRVIHNVGYVLSGSSDSLNNNIFGAKLRLLDLFGNLTFENSFLPGTFGAGFESTELTLDRGFFSTGYVIQSGAIEKMFIVKTDSLFAAQPISIINTSQTIPKEIKLHQNFPNPFNTETIIHFDLPFDVETRLLFYNLSGQEIERVNLGIRKAGSYQYKWNAGHNSSGIYFCKLFVNQTFKTIKIVLLK